MIAETENTLAETRFIPRDYALRAAAIAATFTAGLIAATATVVVTLVHH